MDMLSYFRNAFFSRSPKIQSTDILTWLLIAGAVGLILMLSLKRSFNVDEFEGIKSAWKIFGGQRIYIDFFQHHHPFLYYLLTPLFPLFGETNTTLFAARALMLGFTFGSLIAMHELARRLFSRQVAAVSILLLLSLPLFVGKAIEVRPDVPQTFFGLLSVLLLYRFFDSERRGLLLLSALSLGLAFLFLQKALILIVLVHAVMMYRVICGQLRLSLLLQFSTVLMAMWGGYCAYLAYAGQLSQYWFFNFDLNLYTLDHQKHQTKYLIQHIANFNSVFLGLLLLGLLSRKTQAQRELALMAISLLGVAVLYRVQWPQYYMQVLPLLAIIAASGWETIAQRHSVAGAACLAAAFISASANYTYEIQHRNNQFQLERIEFVLEHSRQSDYVYDGKNRFNIFRKDLDFFWFNVGKGRSLDKYRMLTGYQYDIYELIEKYKPKIISSYAIDNMGHPEIRNHYRRDPVFHRLYLRVD